MSRTLAEPALPPLPALRVHEPISRYQCIVRSAQLRRWTSTYYVLGRGAARFIALCTLRAKVIRPELAERDGGYLLACSHISHLEPFIISVYLDRHIDFMTRIEFYARRWSRTGLNMVGAFPVNRQGTPVSAIRTAIRRAAAGRVVGIFPEGGVASGPDSVCRGGKIRRGVCLIAYRANVPIVPCVMLGTDKLNAVAPWLPFKRARVWIAFGDPIWPDRTLSPRPARAQMAEQFQSVCTGLCRELIAAHGLAEDVVP